MYTNAQSILGKLNELAAIVSEEKADIILKTELWCNVEIGDTVLTIEGYQLEPELRRDRNDTRDGIGGGLLVYSRKVIKVVPEPQFDTNNFNQFCAFKVITKGRHLFFTLAYIFLKSNDCLIVACLDAELGTCVTICVNTSLRH